MGELMKKAPKEATGKEVMQKLDFIGNVFLAKREVSSHEVANRELCLHMHSSNIATEFVSIGPETRRTRIF